MKNLLASLLFGALLSLASIGVALAEDYTVTLTVDGKPITLTVSTGTGDLVVESDTIGVKVVSVDNVVSPSVAAAKIEQYRVNRNANLRSGPGTTFAIVGSTKLGDLVSVVSKNTAGDWYQLSTGNWIAASLLEPAATVPTESRSATPTSAASPTNAIVPTATTTPLPATPTTAPVPQAAAPSAASVSIVIVENKGNTEVLGIRNNSAGSLDLGGWRLYGSKGDDSCTIPGGTVLQAGQTYHVATGDSQPPTPGYKCGSKTIWNNSGETIFLQSTDGQQIQIGT